MIVKKLVTYCIIMASLITSNAMAQQLDSVVAIVNDDVITQSELRNEEKNVALQMRAMGQSMSYDAASKKRVLDHLIDKKLQLQLAKQLHIDISDKELNGVIGKIAAQNNMTMDQLLERIQQEGLNVKAYKSNLREQLLLQKVQQHEVASKIALTPDEVNSALQSQGKSGLAAKKAVENQLLHRKFEEAGKVWLSKLRGIAYIEIK